MRDDFRPKFKEPAPEEPQGPEERQEETTTDPLAGATLPDDHPFATLAGHDPRLMRAMGAALQILADNTPDDGLREKIAQASKGRLDFRDLVNDPAFDEAHQHSAERTSAAMERVTSEDDDERAAARRARAQAHVDRLTDHGRIVDEVKRELGPFAP